uniref:Ig-like domain-containing protein n=1 Tax=Cyprinus carpio TaxID=7962 RepID=A0A8C1XNL0_CYPCA
MQLSLRKIHHLFLFTQMEYFLFSETVEGFIGGSAVLNCSPEEPLITIQDIHVRWRNNHKDQYVYDIIKGQVSVEEQDPEYRDRTESFPEEYLRGNFSIKLNNLQHTDAGLYKCYIIEESVIKSVELSTQGVLIIGKTVKMF